MLPSPTRGAAPSASDERRAIGPPRTGLTITPFDEPRRESGVWRVGLFFPFGAAAVGSGSLRRSSRCTLPRPKLLLADEPTGNLDPETSGKVFDELMVLVHQEGLAALIATHNPEIAGRMDRGVTLRAGKVEAVPAGG